MVFPKGAGAEDRFPFVLVNEGTDPASQKRIRAHAMRESIRRKRTGVKPAEHKSAPAPYRTGRFRLTLKPDKAKTPSRATRENSAECSASKSIDPEHTEESRRTAIEKRSHHALVAAPSGGLLDPFDALPVRVALPQQRLLYFYDQGFKQNSLAFNSKTRIISIASSDPAWFHATLSVVCLTRDLQDGVVGEPSRLGLFHRGEALSILKQRLRDSPTHIADTTIGAVATLANHEVMNGSFISASTHMNGLEQLIKVRGGLNALSNSSDMLLKVISWSDICFSAVWGMKPRFSRIPACEKIPYHKTSLMPEHVNTAAAFQHANLCVDLREIRTLSAIMESRQDDEGAREYFSKSIYRIEYNTASAIGYDSSDHDSLMTQENSSEERVTRIAACLFMNLVLREVPGNAKMHYVMALGMQSILNEAKNDIVLVWSEHLALLLWDIFVGAAAIEGWPERVYFVVKLVTVTKAMDLSTLEEFKEALKMTAWVEIWANRRAETLWSEMEAISFVIEDPTY